MTASRAAKKTKAQGRAAPHLIDQIDAPPAPPCTLVIFGASGDLTHRLLMPALYNLVRAGLDRSGLPRDRRVAPADDRRAVPHRPHDVDRGTISRRPAASSMPRPTASRSNRASGTSCASASTTSRPISSDPASYADLGNLIGSLHQSSGGKDAGLGNVIFYLAIASSLFEPTIDQLASSGLLKQTKTGWRRLIIEKPFGHDLASAKALDKTILKVLREDQVFRIDHFLGKETVQNIMVLRFANGFFEPLWNRQHIDHVQITASETVGVEGRGSFYDATGALRDMVPNHMFQLLAMCAMEAPNSFSADAVRSEKAKVIQAIRELPAREAARTPCAAATWPGTVQGKRVKNYRDEPDVKRDSTTETYVAMKLMIDNWRWADVPFYVRTGKALATRRTEIAIRFKQVPYALFRDLPQAVQPPNELILHVQPEEGISMNFQAKVPGQQLAISGVKMNFKYADYFEAQPNTGYETLIYDCMTGDATLFQRADNIEGGWAAVQPILDAWQKGYGAIVDYKAGSNGPTAADDLLMRDGRRWRDLA